MRVALLSGGLDSAVAAQMVPCTHAISVDYGQRHVVELDAARRVGQALGLEHQFVKVEVPWASSGLLGGDLDRNRAPGEMVSPKSYLPARNVVLLAYALAYAQSVGADEIVTGFNADDREGYPDCRPAFVHAWEVMACEAVDAGVRLLTPLENMTKYGIVAEGGVELMALTWSCYDPQMDSVTDPEPCGTCDACVLRNKAFGV